MRGLSGLIGVVVFALIAVKEVHTLKCMVGYGQRGKLRSGGYEWPRNCEHSTYCWEAVTTDKEKLAVLFDYAWDDYYYEYYVHACSGDYGTDLKVNPFKVKPVPDIVKVNITTERTVTGRGGTVELDMIYACTKNFCSGASRSIYATSSFATIVIALITIVIVN